MTISITTPGVLRRLAAVGALALTVFAVSAAAAQAGQHQRIATKGGTVWFDHTGDYIAALDRRKDGYAVRAYLNWRVGDTLHEEAVTDNTGYTPGPNDPHRAVYRQLSIPEGTSVTLTMCYSQGDFNRRCSAGQRAVA